MPILAPDIRWNEGLLRPVTIRAPEGMVCNATWPAPAGPSLIFVVAGTVTNYTSDDPTCTPHVYTAGSSLVDPGGDDVHILRNEGSVAAETIAVQFLPQGVPRRIDVTPAPGNCSF